MRQFLEISTCHRAAAYSEETRETLMQSTRVDSERFFVKARFGKRSGCFLDLRVRYEEYRKVLPELRQQKAGAAAYFPVQPVQMETGSRRTVPKILSGVRRTV